MAEDIGGHYPAADSHASGAPAEEQLLKTVSERTKERMREVRAHFRPLRGGVRDIPGAGLEILTHIRWLTRRAGRKHNLPKPLIVSLTSYPPRFSTLALSLKCLLTQNIAPDKVVLWIARGDFDQLPDEVLALQEQGLEIALTRDVKSYKKIIPALRAHPDSFILTADDDVYYPSGWLGELVAGYDPSRQEIPAQRVHRIVTDAAGEPVPYMKWEFDVKAGPAHPRNVATGVGGVLYPPGSLHPDVLSETTFKNLCPSSDDLWLYFMARRAGWQVRKIGRRRRYLSWAGSQRIALQHDNVVVGGGNDVQFERLLKHYGSPYGQTPKAPAICAERGRKRPNSDGAERKVASTSR